EADAETELAILAGLDAVGRVDGRPDPALTAALSDAVPIRRAAAALTLARLGAPEAARNALADRDAGVRLRAAQGLLAAREDAAAGPPLTALLAAARGGGAGRAEDLPPGAAAGAAPPHEPLGAAAAADRARCRDGWAAWWRRRGGHLD